MSSSRPRTTPAALADLLRRVRVDGAAVALRGPGALAVEARGAVVTLDAVNAIAEIDGAQTLSSAARRAAQAGAVFPLARPLPALTLTQACAALPYFVDAFVQQASLLSGDGDPAETPRAPRAAAGPSLLGAVCARPPLAVAVRARVRVMPTSLAVVRREEHASTRAAAERVRALLDDGRPFAVDAFGTTVLVLDGSAANAAANAPVLPVALTSAFAHRGAGRRASFARAVSLAPGDVDAMARVLEDGGRVVAAPFMGRCGALLRGDEPLALLDTARGTQLLTASWAPAPSRPATQPPSPAAPSPAAPSPAAPSLAAKDPA